MVMAPTRKPVSPPKATPAIMVSAMTGLNWGSMKKAARPANTDGTEHRDDDQLSGLGLAALEDEKKGDHALQQDQQGDEIVFLPRQIGLADEQGQRDQKQDEGCGYQSPLRQFPFFFRRLHQTLWPEAAAGNGESKNEHTQKHDAVHLKLAARYDCYALLPDQRGQVCNVQSLYEQENDRRAGHRRQKLPPPGQGFGPPVRRVLPGLGQREVILWQLWRRGHCPAAGDNHILRRHRLRQQTAGHTVGGGGVEAVAGEEGPGRPFGDDASVKEQRAAVGVPGAELDIVADHEDGDAPAQQNL